MSLTQYLLEFSICLAIFYALYHFLLSKETYFQVNRWYLLLSPVLSMIIPFLDWELPSDPTQSSWDQIVVPIVTDIQQQQVIIWENLSQPADAARSFTYLDIALLIYLLGMLWMGGRLLYRTWRVMQLIGRGRQQKRPGYTMVSTNAKLPAASFLSYVFWEDGPLDTDRRNILEHELVHVRQWHSLDILLMEIWVMLKWFHPLIYWYRNALRLTHEYIADAYVSGLSDTKLEYARLLARSEASMSANQLLHHFNSSIKMRLLMLAKRRSNTWRYLKLMAILPVTAVLMMLFAFNLSATLPDPITDPLKKLEKELNDIARHPVLTPQEAEISPVAAKNYTLKWGDIECACRNEQFPNYYHCENQSLRPIQLRRLIRKEGGFQVFLEDQPQSITDLKAVSKYMKDMGGYQGQFDEMDQSFNSNSPLWKQAEKGDVFRFTFSNDNGDYFEFDVVMNNRKEDFVFGSRVELGDYHFNINLTNDVGSVHMDVEELQSLVRSPLQVLKNNDEYYSLKSAVIINRNALREDEWPAIRGNTLDISRSNAITEAFPGDRIHFSLVSEAGEKIKFDVMLREKSSWNGRKRDLKVHWGKYSFDMYEPILLTKAELEELKNEDMYLYANGRKHLMKDQEAEVGRRGSSQPMETLKVRGVKDLLDKQLPDMKSGEALNIDQLKSVDDYLTPYLFIRIDFDWPTIFPDHPHLKIGDNNQLIIDKPTPEDWEKVITLKGIRNGLYRIQLGNYVYDPTALRREKNRLPLEEAVNQEKMSEQKLIVSRVECFNCDR